MPSSRVIKTERRDDIAPNENNVDLMVLSENSSGNNSTAVVDRETQVSFFLKELKEVM